VSPSSPSSTAVSLSKHIEVAAPIAGALAGTAAILALVGLIFYIRKRRSTMTAAPDGGYETDNLRGYTTSPLTIRSDKYRNDSFGSQLDAVIAMAGPAALHTEPPRQLRAQRTGLGPQLEEKIRDRDAMENHFGSGNAGTSGATLFEPQHVPDWRDDELDRLRSEAAELHNALNDSRAHTSMPDSLPGYQGTTELPMLDEKIRERDALEEGIRSPSAMGTSSSPPDWRDEQLGRLRTEVGQLHTALGMAPSGSRPSTATRALLD
jgi:hypothetical protein